MKMIGFVCLLLIMDLPTMADRQLDIVTPEWTAAHVNDPSVRILDVRLEFAEYLPGHVPNAVHLADTTMRGPREGMPVMYLPVQLQAQLLERAGVKDNQTIVIYSDRDSVPGATMIAYVLEKIGHPDIKILDGGWSAYKATQKTTQDYPTYKPGTLSVHESRSYVTTDEVVQAIGKPGYKMIDARDAPEYQGQTHLFIRNGHIPGAINIPWPSVMAKDNPHKFKSVTELQSIYDKNGIKESDTIILYCATSRDASVQYAVLKHLLGYPKVLLYEGSWTEYVAHHDLPIKTGPEP